MNARSKGVPADVVNTRVLVPPPFSSLRVRISNILGRLKPRAGMKAPGAALTSAIVVRPPEPSRTAGSRSGGKICLV